VSEVDAGTVVHTYCAVPGATEVGTAGGIDGSSVSTVAVGQVALVIGELSAERYGADAWRKHATDSEWLAEVVGQHHAVLQAALAETDVLPLRLPGIYQDVAALRRIYAAQEDALAQALSSIRGQVEMGAKVYLSKATPAAASAASGESGRGYLTRRISEAAEREESRQRQQAMVVEAHDTLSQQAKRAVVNEPQDPALSGRREPMLLNAAYLIPRNSQNEFAACSETLHHALASEGLLLEVTGPWPAYNFAELSLSKAPAP